jgi:hypothetical protein
MTSFRNSGRQNIVTAAKPDVVITDPRGTKRLQDPAPRVQRPTL